MIRRRKITVDHVNGLYKNLALVTGLSPRLVKNYHEQHVERCWCGNWINNFLNDFFINKDNKEIREGALNSLLDHHEYMKNISDDEFFGMIRSRAWKKLGRPRRRLSVKRRG